MSVSLAELARLTVDDDSGWHRHSFPYPERSERHGQAVHKRTIDHLPTNTGYQRFTKRLALFITQNIGTMTCFWLFCVISAVPAARGPVRGAHHRDGQLPDGRGFHPDRLLDLAKLHPASAALCSDGWPEPPGHPYRGRAESRS